jgi:PAS domain-containing protein
MSMRASTSRGSRQPAPGRSGGLAPAGLLIALLGGLFYRMRRARPGGCADRAVGSGAEASERAAEELAAERRRLSTVIEATDVGTWECDFTTGITQVNRRWGRDAGLPGPRIWRR